MKIAVLPGDDIGPEITDATVSVLEAADRRFGLDLSFDVLDVGMAAYRKSGLMLSAAMLLQWLGERHQLREFAQAAASIEAAADAAMLDPASRTADLGGSGGTTAFAEAVVRGSRE